MGPEPLAFADPEPWELCLSFMGFCPLPRNKTIVILNVFWLPRNQTVLVCVCWVYPHYPLLGLWGMDYATPRNGMLVVHLRDAALTSGAQGDLGMVGPEPEEREDPLCEGGPECEEQGLVLRISKGHPSFFIVQTDLDPA